LRLKQELLLGIGGWRLLRALGCNRRSATDEGTRRSPSWNVPTSSWKIRGSPLKSRWRPRAGNLFTTLTAVAAGFDRFAPALIEQYLRVCRKELGIAFHDLLALGRQNPLDSSSLSTWRIWPSAAVRGECVSRLHGEVSRRLFLPLFPRWPETKSRGTCDQRVHMPTWDSARR